MSIANENPWDYIAVVRVRMRDDSTFVAIAHLHEGLTVKGFGASESLARGHMLSKIREYMGLV